MRPIDGGARVDQNGEEETETEKNVGLVLQRTGVINELTSYVHNSEGNTLYVALRFDLAFVHTINKNMIQNENDEDNNTI